MRLPDLLPPDLAFCSKAINTDELYQQLIKKPSHAVLFFEIASDDETWSDTHAEFMRQLLNFFTKFSFQGKLEPSLSQRIVQTTWRHSPILVPLISEDLPFKLKDGNASINSLFLRTNSDILRQIMLKEYASEESEIVLKDPLQNRKPLVFLDLSESDFVLLREYIYTGKVQVLWKKDKKELVTLLGRADAWHLDGMVELCEKTLIKYIEDNNVEEVLKMACSRHWEHLKNGCIDYINKLEMGMRLFSLGIGHLGLEFFDYEEKTLRRFVALRFILTELVCTGNVAKDPSFAVVVKQCPNLLQINISGTAEFNENFLSFPLTIQKLNLSQCPWISKDKLKQFAGLYPGLEALSLGSDIHLNYLTWEELQKFKQLKRLDLSHCHQIKNEDLAIILKATSALKELNLDDCDKVNEAGFFELAKYAQYVTALTLSRTNITDSAVVEIAVRCKLLSSLDLSYCSQVTEKAIIAILKEGGNLKSLALTRTQLSPRFIEEMKMRYPKVEFSF